MAIAWGVSWGSSWGVSWGSSVIPPTPPPAWQPAQGSQGGSTMRLPRPPGRFGEDHAVYHGTNAEPRPEPVLEAPEPVDTADLAEHADLVAQKLKLAAEAAAITKLEQAANATAERLVARETQRLAELEAEQQRRLENEELAMLVIAIAAAV